MSSFGWSEETVTARGDISRGEATVDKLSVRVRLFPIVFFVTYLNFTVFLFAFGPWPYPVVDGTKLYVFLAFAHFALLGGYLSAAFRRSRGYYGHWSVRRLVAISLAVNLLLFFPTLVFRTGSVIPDLVRAFADPGEVYARGRVLRQEGMPIIEYVRFLLGPLLFMLFPLAVFYWRRLKPIVRGLAVLSILGSLAIGLTMGVNRDFVFTVILVTWMLFARHLAGEHRLKWFSKRILGAATIVALALFFLYFAATMNTRPSGIVIGFDSGTGAYAEYDHLMVRNLSPRTKVGVLGVVSYLSQGYYALYLSLEKPFVPMFGVGHSMFVTRQAARITGIDELKSRSYPDRIMIEDDWNSYGRYTTIYPWIASDVSFPGTILVVFLIGRLLAFSWLDTLRGINPFAVVMFAQFVMMLFAFVTVNWIVNAGEGFSAFWGILLLWLFTRRKYVWRRR